MDNVLQLHGKLYDYKMSKHNDITSHMRNIESMATIFQDLGHPSNEKMILSKILSSLPRSYNNIITALSSVAQDNQMVNYLEDKLLQYKALLSLQETVEDIEEKVFLIQTSTSIGQILHKEQH